MIDTCHHVHDGACDSISLYATFLALCKGGEFSTKKEKLTPFNKKKHIELVATGGMRAAFFLD